MTNIKTISRIETIAFVNTIMNVTENDGLRARWEALVGRLQKKRNWIELVINNENLYFYIIRFYFENRNNVGKGV